MEEPKIKDFIARLREMDIDGVDDALVMCVYLQTLEDITQEINIAIYGLMKGSKTKHDIQVTLSNAGKVYGNDNMYMLSRLLNHHGENLKNVSRVMDEIIKEPSAKRMKELAQKEQLLAGEYPKAHKTIAKTRYEEFMEVVYEGMGQDD